MDNPAPGAEKATDQQLQKAPSARTIARLMTTARDHSSKSDTVTIAAIETGVPILVQARTLIDRFHAMIRKRKEEELEPWITEARASLIASFATGITSDKPAVRAAITEPWSNGQTEGQITKLKLVKRQMYGRAKIDLLQASGERLTEESFCGFPFRPVHASLGHAHWDFVRRSTL